MTLGTDATYARLVSTFAPRAIHTEEQYEKAMAVIEALLSAGDPARSELDYLETLSLLVERYEQQHVPMDQISGTALLKILMDERGLKRKDLLDIFKTESILSEIFSGKRQLNRHHIEGLARRFSISPAVFF